MRDRTLLVVDDDALWLKTLTNLFGLLNCKVLTAATCAGGIKLAQLHKPACILLDFGLPDAKGSAFASLIKQDPVLRKTPIIMVSGEAEEEFRACYDYGLDGFFLKGWRLDRLTARVKCLLRRVDMDRDMLTCCDLRLDGGTFQVFRDSKPVANLSPDQFSLLSLLIEQAPNFVHGKAVARHIFGETADEGKADAVKMLVYRLRKKLGRKLARRVKCAKNKGWIYLSPQPRPA